MSSRLENIAVTLILVGAAGIVGMGLGAFWIFFGWVWGALALATLCIGVGFIMLGAS